MSETRQLALATALLLPSILAAMTIVSYFTKTVSSFPLVVAALGMSVFGLAMSVFGLVLYFALPFAIFRALVHVGKNAHRVHALAIVLFGLTVVLGIVWIVVSWSYGEKYQGHVVTLTLAALNGATALFLFLCLIANRRHPSFQSGLLFNWLLVVWLFAWAFPYLGEYP
jgi:hypothetical protein